MAKSLEEMTYTERKEIPGLTLYEQLYGRREHDVKRDLLANMKSLGICNIEATYSGGHDEGGVQEMSAYNFSGELVMENDENRDDYQLLIRSCDEVLSTKFFSWALGFSVYGTLMVDLNEKRAWTVGEHEVMETDPDPLEWRL